ncbi:MBL fold metallo-hydrolase [Acinetobacter sp. dk771]|uniref:MBL fold metallo-hydrolase n=1 Tax=Acinetobacter wanghuae TaxID=2662362 RepID=A0AA91AFG0_9GAMM|nr:MBL fold metallo-hydrolase [Acinetobacter wanghuae]MQW92041.1 MBL fold metallo-hydrolase [Acinetobacter wanghuae]
MNKILSRSVIALSLMTASLGLYANDKQVQRDTSKVTQIQEIRNATIKVTYADTTFLIDPMFAKKGFYEGFPDTHQSYLRNPLVDLPIQPETILAGVDAVIVTHTHLDHWDDAAQAAIPKDIPLFVQHKQDQKLIQSQGFKDVRILTKTTFEGIQLTKTGGQHGTDAMYRIPQLKAALGEAMGIIFEATGHETVYVAGDTIWRPEVDQTIQTFKPDVIVLNTGNALVNGFKESIIMGKEDTYHATQKAPHAKVIAVHMDAINHMSLTRAQLAEYVKDKGIQDQVLIPVDGETLSF